MRKIVNKQLGAFLVECGVISQAQLDSALVLQKQKGGLIGEILVDLGFVREENIAQALTAQYGFPYLPLSNYEINIEVLNLIPARVAKQYLLVPIDKLGNNLSLVMSNPLNVQAIEDVEMLSGCHVQTFVTTATDIKDAIKKHYGDKE